jgi:hypothetical protein
MPLALQHDPVHQISEMLVTLLRGLDWPADVTFRYVTAPEIEKEQLGKEIHVLINGETTEQERAARGVTTDDVQVVFAVRAACKPDDVQRFRRLQSIGYSIGVEILKLRRTQLDATPRVIRMIRSYDVERLRKGEFLSIRAAHFMDRREIA